MRYIVEELLLEQPHVFLDMDTEVDEPKVWDFCAEDKPKMWVVQLINLYALKKLVTLNKDKNQSLVMHLTDEEIEEFTKSMVNDPFFVAQAKRCVKDLAKDKKFKTIRMLDKFLPKELKDALEIN
jgi:hypothetical protein